MVTRKTKQKEAIATLFQEFSYPLSIEQIHHEGLKKVPSLGIATVYRLVKSLLEEGIISTVDIPGLSPFYERAHKEHHHHFYCTGCHHLFELEKCPSGIHELTPKNFTLTSHEIILYGFCSSCQQ